LQHASQKGYDEYMNKTQRKGYTLIELMIVVSIIVILTLASVISYVKATERSRNGKRQADLEAVRAALVLYRTDHASYPVSATYAGMMSALTSPQAYINNANIQDPKNASPYIYTYTSGANGRTFTLCGALEPSATSYCVTNP
jgi:prepilin-type N-terminal cleavage/methylation domain-containing protein